MRSSRRSIVLSDIVFLFQAAPKDKLLVFKCSEGWKPLCEFLGVPVPDAPFPHKNIRGDIVKDLDSMPLFRKIKREVITSLLLITVSTGIVLYYSYEYGPMEVARTICYQTGSLLQKFRFW